MFTSYFNSIYNPVPKTLLEIDLAFRINLFKFYFISDTDKSIHYTGQEESLLISTVAGTYRGPLTSDILQYHRMQKTSEIFSKVLILLIAVLNRCSNKGSVEFFWSSWTAWQFRVILTSYKEFIFRNFHDFYQTIVWRNSWKDKTCCLKLLTEGIIKLITVTVTALHHFLIGDKQQQPRATFQLDG